MRHHITIIENAIFEAKSEEIINVANSQTVRVWANPSRIDIVVLAERFGELRGLIDAHAGKVYVWQAMDMPHFYALRSIAAALGYSGQDLRSMMPLSMNFYVINGEARDGVSNEWERDGHGSQLDETVWLFSASDHALDLQKQIPAFARIIPSQAIA